MEIKSEIWKFFNSKHFMSPITSVESFIRAYGNHCFSANCIMHLDVKETTFVYCMDYASPSYNMRACAGGLLALAPSGELAEL